MELIVGHAYIKNREIRRELHFNNDSDERYVRKCIENLVVEHGHKIGAGDRGFYMLKTMSDKRDEFKRLGKPALKKLVRAYIVTGRTMPSTVKKLLRELGV